MKNKKEKSKKSFLSLPKLDKRMLKIGAASLGLLIIFCIGLAVSNSRKFIAIYGLDKNQAEAVQALIKKISDENKLKYDFEVYSTDKSLESQIPLSGKPELIITTSGHAVEAALSRSDKKAGTNPEIASGMTSSMRSMVKSKNGQVSALPILSDNMEINVNLQSFRNSGLPAIATWKDFESFLTIEKKKSSFPLVFAGTDGRSLLNILGALCEALDGVDSYNQAVKIIREGKEKKFNSVKIARELADNPDSPLITSIRFLQDWNKKGLISQNLFSMTVSDVRAFVGQNVTSSTFMTLSNHRNCDQKGISRFTSIYFPSARPASSRSFTSPTVYAVQLKKADSAAKLMNLLASTEIQEELSRGTGLAPVLAHCRTPDKQADDVRYWVAATNPPLAGLGNEVFLAPEELRSLGKELAAKINY